MIANVAATQMVSLDAIVFDSETQPRVSIVSEKVDEYRADIEGGADFPPLALFFDGDDYWIGDGYHRAMGFRAAGHKEVPADVRPGGKRDAILHAVGANATHGMPRTNADKRRAVMMMIEDEEWSKWSDHLIAKKCSVSHTFVSKFRPEPKSTSNGCKLNQRTGLDGRTRDTSNIGKSRKTTPSPAHPQQPSAAYSPSQSEPDTPFVAPPVSPIPATPTERSPVDREPFRLASSLSELPMISLANQARRLASKLCDDADDADTDGLRDSSQRCRMAAEMIVELTQRLIGSAMQPNQGATR